MIGGVTPYPEGWAADGPVPRSSADVGEADAVTGRGGCLCAGVRYRTEAPLRPVRRCYCERCRRTSGHMVAASGVQAAALVLEAAGPLRWFHPPDAADVAYGFCATCGSSLFWFTRGRDVISLHAGGLDQPTRLVTIEALFCDDRPDYDVESPDFVSRARE